MPLKVVNFITTCRICLFMESHIPCRAGFPLFLSIRKHLILLCIFYYGLSCEKFHWKWHDQGNDNPKKLKQSNKFMAQGGKIQFLHPLQPCNLRKEKFPRPCVTKIWPTSRDYRTSAKILTKMPKSHMEKPNYNVFFFSQFTNKSQIAHADDANIGSAWQKHKEHISSFSASQNTSWNLYEFGMWN